jgi:O-Antigen ligase
MMAAARSNPAAAAAVAVAFTLPLLASAHPFLLAGCALVVVVAVASRSSLALAVSTAAATGILLRAFPLNANPFGAGGKVFFAAVAVAATAAAASARARQRSDVAIARRLFILALVGLSVMLEVREPPPHATAHAFALQVAVPAVVLSLTSLHDQRILRWAALGAAAVAVLLLLPLGNALHFQDGALWWRASPIWVGRALALGGIAALTTAFPVRTRVVITLLVGLAIARVGELGPAVGAAVGLIVLIATRRNPGGRDLSRRRIVALGYVSIGLFLAFGDAVWRLTTAQQTSASRLVAYQVAWHTFRAHPWLGSGVGSFSLTFHPSTGGTEVLVYPHNLLLEALAETGLAGASLLCILWGIGLWVAFKTPTLAPLAVTALVFSQFSGSIAGNYEFVSVCAVCFAVARTHRQDRRNPPEELYMHKRDVVHV